MTINLLSVCSGLGSAELIAAELSWHSVGVSEIEKFPSAILAYRFPDVPNLGDMTKIDVAALPAVDVLCGGTPCQAFSVAGKRLSLADARGNLSLAFTVLAHELARSHGLRNCLWENVPGVLNTPDNAFGCFLAALIGADAPLRQPAGEGWNRAGMASGPRARLAWRIFDAQYFGLAQRRERVFLVADFGDGADPAKVLFERQGLRGNSPPRREKGKGIAAPIASGSRGSSGYRNDADTTDNLIALIALGGNDTRRPIDVATACNAHGGSGCMDFETESFVVEAFDARQRDVCLYGDLAAPLDTDGFTQALAFDLRGREGGAQFEGPHDTANMRAANGGSSRSYVATQLAVRRLLPVECERLQGVPDNFTKIPYRGKPAEQCADGPRYKALGNGWALPCARWILKRIDEEIRK